MLKEHLLSILEAMKRMKKEAHSLLLNSEMGGLRRPPAQGRRRAKAERLLNQKHAANYDKQDVGELHELFLTDTLLDKTAQPGGKNKQRDAHCQR